LKLCIVVLTSEDWRSEMDQITQIEATKYFSEWLDWWKSAGDLNDEGPKKPSNLPNHFILKFKTAAEIVAASVEGK